MINLLDSNDNVVCPHCGSDENKVISVNTDPEGAGPGQYRVQVNLQCAREHFWSLVLYQSGDQAQMSVV